MPVNTPFRTNTSLGPNLDQVVKKDNVWYEGAGRAAGGLGQIGSPQLGDLSRGSDGRDYVWVEATAAITVGAAPGTQVTAPASPNFTVAAGTGGFYLGPNTVNYKGTIAAGDRFWVAKGNTVLA